jgi:hypothetical protein
MIKNEKCASCPLAEILELAIGLNKVRFQQKFKKDFKRVKDYQPLLDLSKQLN